MVRYLVQADGTSKLDLVDATGSLILAANTLTIVSNTFTYKYSITAIIAKLFTFIYSITGTITKTFSYLYDINDSGSEVLAEQKGTVTSTHLQSLNNEVCFLTKSDGPRHYSLYIFVDNMQSGDEIIFKTQILDPTSNTWKSYDDESKINYHSIKGDIAPFQVFLPARQIRFCIRQTKGTLRNYNWALYKAL